MIALFKKKVPLKEHLKGFIDIHNHILPGIDDGAQTVEDAIALVKKYEELGITNFIATPHIMNDYYPNTPESITLAHNKLEKGLILENLIHVKIRFAAEYMMDQPFLELLEKERLLTLSDNYILVEMSYFQAPINISEILFKLQTQKYKPVLAHPERYGYLHTKDLKRYEDLKSRGCYFQLNILSLLGHYGKGAQETAFRLLDHGMIDFIGTDTHQLRHLEKLSKEKILKSRMDQLMPVFQKTIAVFMPTSF